MENGPGHLGFVLFFCTEGPKSDDISKKGAWDPSFDKHLPFSTLCIVTPTGTSGRSYKECNGTLIEPIRSFLVTMKHVGLTNPPEWSGENRLLSSALNPLIFW